MTAFWQPGSLDINDVRDVLNLIEPLPPGWRILIIDSGKVTLGSPTTGGSMNLYFVEGRWAVYGAESSLSPREGIITRLRDEARRRAEDATILYAEAAAWEKRIGA